MAIVPCEPVILFSPNLHRNVASERLNREEPASEALRKMGKNSARCDSSSIRKQHVRTRSSIETVSFAIFSFKRPIGLNICIPQEMQASPRRPVLFSYVRRVNSDQPAEKFFALQLAPFRSINSKDALISLEISKNVPLEREGMN